MHGIAIIGSNYGDEGKGLMTDYFARKYPDSLVVRFNGGAQAGHTVCDLNNRWVFHHFGSGTIAGANTYLSEDFIVNPNLFVKEERTLTGFDTLIDIHPQAKVTLPYDMLLNQELERILGNDRHGSCGVGIHETLERHNSLPITYGDLFYENIIRRTIEQYRIRYLPNRLHKLGIHPNREFWFRLYNENIVSNFIDDCFEITLKAPCKSKIELTDYDTIIFEGAQGLLLDQDNKENYPHVTHSKTGIHNVVKIAESLDFDTFEIVYVSRSYLTRHGAGPFNVPAISYDPAWDPTNIPNEFQGSLRFGKLNPRALADRIWGDIKANSPIKSKTVPRVSVAITCLDQVDSLKEIQEVLGDIEYKSFGPTAFDVVPAF